jgi:electron transfer flavoprotein alpha subunit
MGQLHIKIFMKIIVCVKQVPNTEEVRIDPTNNTLVRSGVESVINPMDLNAIEEAVRIKEKNGGKVIALTMGPPQAKEAIREALARGVDQGYLLSDKKFGGADTFATSFVISEAIKHLGGADLVICGKQAIDGDTAQVGPGVADFLNIPHIAYVSRLNELSDNHIVLESMNDNGYSIIRSSFPVLITVVKSINVPRLTNLKKWAHARHQTIPVLDSKVLHIDENKIGLNGSPTRVKKIQTINYSKKVKILRGDVHDIARTLNEIIAENYEGKNNERKTNIDLDDIKEIDDSRKILVIGELCDDKIMRITHELTSAAKKLAFDRNAQVHVVFAGNDCDKVINENVLPDAHDIHFIERSDFNPLDMESHADILKDLILEINPEIMLGGATSMGRSLMPRLAVKLKTGLTADCTELSIDKDSGNLLQIRPAYGGNILASIICPDHRPQMATVRPHVIPYYDSLKKNNPNIHRIKPVSRSAKPSIEVIDIIKDNGKNKDIANVPVIISGGKGLGGEEGFLLLDELAELIGGAVGATRSAVDAGWTSYSQQIGQTGKTVQPKIYLACGISGAIQHMVGMQSSDMIIAINKDQHAPIFQISDYGIILDYKLVIRELIKINKVSK